MTLEKVMLDLVSKPSKDAAADLRTLRDAFVKRAGRIGESELTRFSDLTLSLLERVPLIERMAFARQIAAQRSTPRQLLTLLANDHYLVSAPVLESSPLLDEVDLLEVISRHGAAVCLAIAKRDGLSVQMTDMLMSDAENKVQHALARNTGARLSRKTMIALCDLAEEDEGVRMAMGLRRDLPQALSSRLKSIGGDPVARTSVPVTAEAGVTTGRGRAGIVLSANLVAPAKPKIKEQKTIRYS